MPLKKNHSIVEENLDIKLDAEYARFLDEYGDYEKEGIEIYGYSPEYTSIDKIPCVIGATKLYRDSHKLTSSEIVLADSGYESAIIILNNDSGEIFEVTLNKNKVQKIAKSFTSWFTMMKGEGVK